MCGIVAATGKRDVVSNLIEGLRRLEYRGYDSCGIATLDNGVLKRAREALQKPSLILRLENFHLLHRLNYCTNDCSGYF